MKITEKKENGILTITVEGRIDSPSSPELEAVVKKEIERCKEIVFDFNKLDYICSSGLRILLGAQKYMGENGIKIINVNDEVYEIFEVTGFSFILNIERK